MQAYIIWATYACIIHLTSAGANYCILLDLYSLYLDHLTNVLSNKWQQNDPHVVHDLNGISIMFT